MLLACGGKRGVAHECGLTLRLHMYVLTSTCALVPRSRRRLVIRVRDSAAAASAADADPAELLHEYVIQLQTEPAAASYASGLAFVQARARRATRVSALTFPLPFWHVGRAYLKPLLMYTKPSFIGCPSRAPAS